MDGLPFQNFRPGKLGVRVVIGPDCGFLPSDPLEYVIVPWFHGRDAHALRCSPALLEPEGGMPVFDLGDKVVYPHHGAGTVVQKETKNVLGEDREYLTIRIIHNDMTVMVPSDNVDKAGLRKVIGEDTVEEVLGVIQGGGTKMPKNWNRRFKHNRDKMKTGDIFELAEVVRNLSIRDGDKGLSTGEKQMFGKAKKILASELMYAKDMSEEEADEYLDTLLEKVAKTRVATPVGADDSDLDEMDD